MRKNTASQVIGAQMVSATDGSAFTGSVTVAVTGDGGTQATGSVGSGACTHEGGGYHTYVPAQAETNYNLVAFTFSGTGAVPVTIQIYTESINRHDTVRLGLTALPDAAADAAGGLVISDAGGLDLDTKLAVATSALATPTNITAGTITTVTNLTNLPTIPTNWLTAAGLATDAVAEIQSGLATASSLATVAGYLDTEIAAILADTNELQTDWANGGRLDLILDTAALGGSGGLDAAGVRAAIGLASANLDTQLAALPTAAENADAVWDEATSGHATAGSYGASVIIIGVEYIHTNDTTAETANVTITKA